MMHRKAEFAIGHGVAVHAEPAVDPWSTTQVDRATEVSTTVLPWYDVPVTRRRRTMSSPTCSAVSKASNSTWPT